ncbi:MAG: PxKF domain-containing protein, partial [Methylococcaceae bacterium]|nr:PxKF domain-containing protein [Methylococcaceae bacterium]
MKNTICSFNFVRVLAIAMLLGLLPGSVFAQTPEPTQVIVPVPGGPLTVNVVAVNDGAGRQTDPHVSGDWVSYTDDPGIRFQNLDVGTASDRLIPVPENHWDELSDISGNTIVFTRVTSTSHGIYMIQIDSFGNSGPAIEVSPSTNPLRRRAAVGGDTIAYEDRGYDPSPSPQSEISLSNVSDPAALASRLTNDTLDDLWPAVSPDGNAVVWVKCPTACGSNTVGNIWRAERTDGAWGAPERVTGAGNATLPDTNGPVTVYDQNDGGDRDIRWSVKDASGAYVESVLDLPGIQRNPNMAGDLISFESNAGSGTQFDIFLYDLATNRLYQLTDTWISESLTDITTNAFGVVRIAWALPKQVYPYDMDVYAMSFVLPPLDTDTTPPTITLTTPAEGAVYLLGQTVNADYACQDESGGSGLASCVGDVPNGSPIDTGSIGVKTFTVNAADNAGNTASVTHTYRVIYNFTGFTSPVDNPSVMNTAKAGQSIPLKWRITDANGNPVTNLTGVSVTAVSLSCPSAPTTDAIEEYVVSNSGLQNLGDGYYQWNWKSPGTY